MASKIRRFLLHTLLPISFWLVVWEIAAITLKNKYETSYFLPDVAETATALQRIFSSPEFPTIVLFTLFRVFGGIALGTLCGTSIAILSHKFKAIYSLIAPVNSVIKATPVASIIILLWMTPMNGSGIAIFIAFLIVFPIIFQNIYDAFQSIDKDLIEVSKIYEFSYKKHLKLLVLPALKQYFIPALITSIGLTFKAEIAAEIIVGVTNSIGDMIRHAKDALAIDEMFAWTIVGVAFSVLIEQIAKCLLSTYKTINKEAKI